MFKNILVPLDGSSVSEAALPYAVALAGRTGAKLTLVRAVSAPAHSRDSAASQREAVRQAESYLEDHASKLRSQDYVVETAASSGSTATDWIVEDLELRHADMIVMATHDRVGPDRWRHGSVAEQVISQATVPVVVVRAPDTVRPVEHFDWRQPVLVVPLDGSSLAEAALPVANQLAEALDGRVILVTVLPDPTVLAASYAPAVPTTFGDPEVDEAEMRQYLTTAARGFTTSGIPSETFVQSGDPATEIAHIAQQRNAAAILMSTHGRTGLVRTVLGSVAGNVVHRSLSPVILIRPGSDRQPAQSTAPIREVASTGA